VHFCTIIDEVKELLEPDLENVNKLIKYSNLLSNCQDNISTGRNILSSQISNSNLDNKDDTNQTICNSVEQIKSDINELINLYANIVTEAEQTATKLSAMK